MKELKQKIYKLLPDLKKLEFGCEVKYNTCPYREDPPMWEKGKMICFTNSFHEEIMLICDGATYDKVKRGEYELIGKPIGIVEVLRALPSGKKIGYKEVALTISNDNKTLYLDYKGKSCNWNLEKDNIDDNPDAWERLNSIIN